jgi:hypothetical protein
MMNHVKRAPDVFEIFEEFGKAKTRQDRKDVLLKYQDVPALKDVLRGTFDESLRFILPEGVPPYTPNRPESTPSSLRKLHKQFGYFVAGGPGTNMKAFKRENKFVRLLESIHPKDAEIVLSMVAKKSPVKYLTKKLTEETFPKLIQK